MTLLAIVLFGAIFSFVILFLRFREELAELKRKVDALEKWRVAVRAEMSQMRVALSPPAEERVETTVESNLAPVEVDQKPGLRESVPPYEDSPVPGLSSPEKREDLGSVALPSSTPAGKGPEPLASTSRAASTESGVSDIMEERFAQLKEFLFGGNMTVKGGIVLLLIGISFLFRYVKPYLHVPVEVRLALVALGALAMLAIGWRLRRSKRELALSLQGGGVAILYLTIYFAFGYFALIPAFLAFSLLVVVVALVSFLGVRQDSFSLSAMGALGGYAAPLLTASGSGNHIYLFGYYAVLNAGILSIAWFRSWRLLNSMAFLFTFTIGGLWGANSYQPEMFWSVELFLILFFLQFFVIGMIFASRESSRRDMYLDGKIIFGTPVLSFGMQIYLLEGSPMALAYSAMGLSAWYILFARLLAKKGEELRLFTESSIAVGVIFLTVTIPLALDSNWTTALWALEGAGIYWAGLRQNRILPRISGLLLQAGSVFFFVQGHSDLAEGPAFRNALYIGTRMIGVSALAISFITHRFERESASWKKILTGFAFLWGVLWIVPWDLYEMSRVVFGVNYFASNIIYFSVVSLLLFFWGKRTRFPWGWGFPVVLFPLSFVWASLVFFDVFAMTLFETFAWFLFFGVSYSIFLNSSNLVKDSSFKGIRLAVSPYLTLLGIFLITFKLHALVPESDHLARDWAGTIFFLIPGLALLAIPQNLFRQLWTGSLDEQRKIEAFTIPPLAVYLAFRVLLQNFLDAGGSDPIPFVSLLNPLEISFLFVLFVFAIVLIKVAKGWREDWKGSGKSWSGLPAGFGLLALLAFLILNGIVARAAHHYFHVSFDPDGILSSVELQAIYSLLWGSLSLLTMWWGAKKFSRGIWIGGAIVLVITVVKLFLLDLSGAGTLSRIVSFMGLGLLMLAIGYFSPLPPERKDDTTLP